jgi:hypothetical protein
LKGGGASLRERNVPQLWIIWRKRRRNAIGNIFIRAGVSRVISGIATTMSHTPGKHMQKLLLGLVASTFVCSGVMADTAPPPVSGDDIPSAYVWLSGGSIAIGIGYAWGHGTLYYSKDQKQYPFKLSGVSVADVGGASITAEGEVYNLSNPADLNGTYSTVTAGLTVVAGGSVAYLKNDKGVIIKLHSQTAGLRFNLSADGMRITVQKS